MNNDSSSKISEKDKRILFLLNKYKARMHIINCIYQSELFNKNLSIQEILENCGENQLNANEIESLKIIEAKYDVFTRIAKKFISEDWEWNRILPLSRAIIIYGEYELLFNDPRVVINEMVNISKIYSPNNDYKFINKVLDLVSKNVIKKNTKDEKEN